MDLLNCLAGPLKAARRRKSLLLFFAATHIVFLVFGQWMVAQEVPAVVFMRAEQLKAIQTLPYLQPLTGLLAGSLPLKILYTFFFNLVFGAFLSTTIMGFIFFVPYMIAVWRGFIIDMLVYGIDTTPSMIAVFYGTFILEFGAYSISSAIGTDAGLSLLFPWRKGTESRWEALKMAMREGRELYLLVVILLFAGAIWEMTWLEYMGPLIKLGGIE